MNVVPEHKDPSIFGMPAVKGRWLFVAIGLVVNLCLGTIYSWSVFVQPLTSYFTQDLGTPVTASEMLLPFSVFLAFFAIAMGFAGKYVSPGSDGSLPRWSPP
jgi:OFA family oxalate/formate antiporter-like MFS transporter